MSNTTIKCPECGGDRTVPAGPNKYSCQYCGATFVNNSAPAAPMKIAVSFCRFCGEEILPGAQKCPHCGEWQNSPVAVAAPRPVYQPSYTPHQVSSKSKVAAALLAFFLGGLGIHEFYLGRTGAGVAFLLATILTGWLIFPLFIIGAINLIQTIYYLSMSDSAFAAKYH